MPLLASFADCFSASLGTTRRSRCAPDPPTSRLCRKPTSDRRSDRSPGPLPASRRARGWHPPCSWAGEAHPRLGGSMRTVVFAAVPLASLIACSHAQPAPVATPVAAPAAPVQVFAEPAPAPQPVTAPAQPQLTTLGVYFD